MELPDKVGGEHDEDDVGEHVGDCYGCVAAALARKSVEVSFNGQGCMEKISLPGSRIRVEKR